MTLQADWSVDAPYNDAPYNDAFGSSDSFGQGDGNGDGAQFPSGPLFGYSTQPFARRRPNLDELSQERDTTLGRWGSRMPSDKDKQPRTNVKNGELLALCIVSFDYMSGAAGYSCSCSANRGVSFPMQCHHKSLVRERIKSIAACSVCKALCMPGIMPQCQMLYLMLAHYFY